ncbi:MAG: hypothetical protein WCK67_04815 [bacterium]
MQPTMNPGFTQNLEAVGIHIYNPTVNAGSANIPQAQSPYIQQEQQLDKSYYNVQQNSVYGNQPGTANAYAAYAAPMLNNQVKAAPPQVTQPAPVPVPPPQIDQVAPAPVQTPPAPVAVAPTPPAPVAPPVVEAPPAPVAQTPVAPQAPAPVQQPPAPVAQAPVAAAPAPAAPPADPAKAEAQELVAGLQGPVAKQTESIQKLADLGQNNPQKTTALLKTAGPEVLQGLVSVFNQKAEGPDAKAIDDNKRIAMFTTAIMQKNFRDAMNGEIQNLNKTQGQNIPTVGITELPGINELVMKMSPDNEPNPEVRSAAIQSLNFLAQPEDNATVSDLLNAVVGVPNDPQKPGDPDPNVKAAAQAALAALPPAPTPAAPVAPPAEQAAAPAAQEAPPAEQPQPKAA